MSHPGLVGHVAAQIAAIKDVSLAHVLEATRANVAAVYGLAWPMKEHKTNVRGHWTRVPHGRSEALVQEAVGAMREQVSRVKTETKAQVRRKVIENSPHANGPDSRVRVTRPRVIHSDDSSDEESNQAPLAKPKAVKASQNVKATRPRVIASDESSEDETEPTVKEATVETAKKLLYEDFDVDEVFKSFVLVVLLS